MAVVLLVAVVAASTAAPWELQDRDLPAWFAQPELDLPELELDEPEQAEAEGELPEREDGDGWDVGWVVALVWVLIAGLAIVVLRWLWVRFRHSQVAERVGPTGHGPAVPTEMDEPDLPVLQQGATAARTLLDGERDPSRAIIAAWLALEGAAASAGVTRAPSQTPTEFTLAVLDRTDADGDATRGLLDLYLRARFSGVPSDDADVESARACLVTLAEAWHVSVTDEGRHR